ncbi:hypothetical protein GW17_00040790 [Ensete ventricosum]|nr:hypothetical protein GW17_00040790 [Ensete ventricosum]
MGMGVAMETGPFDFGCGNHEDEDASTCPLVDFCHRKDVLRLTAPSAGLCIGSSVAHPPLFRDLLQLAKRLLVFHPRKASVIKSDYYDDRRRGRVVVLRPHSRPGLRDHRLLRVRAQATG